MNNPLYSAIDKAERLFKSQAQEIERLEAENELLRGRIAEFTPFLISIIEDGDLALYDNEWTGQIITLLAKIKEPDNES